MKTTVKLTPENAATLSWCSKLTGLPAEESINFFLAEYFENFNEDTTTAFPRRLQFYVQDYKYGAPYICSPRT